MERREREPAGMVTAVSEPLQIGEVIILPSYKDAGDAYRFQVVRQLTRAEFVERMAYNRKQPGHAAFCTDMVGSVALPLTTEDADGPTPEQRFFYALEPV